jgi:uncharacterized membrane protein HdeD (DUF308 family)
MKPTESGNQITASTTQTALSFRNLYLLRAGFSVTWAVLIALFAKTELTLATVLFVIYPLWDVAATLLDIKATNNSASTKPQLLNIGIGVLVTGAVIIALQHGVPQALMVFGAWAILTGLIQLILAIKRRKLGGQWPMMVSGGQSMIGGTSFIILAHAPTMGIASLAGYATFGAFYYLLAAWRLSKKASAANNN